MKPLPIVTAINLLPSVASAADPEAGTGSGHVAQTIVGPVVVGLFVLLSLERAHRVLVAASAVSVLWLVHYLTPWPTISFEEATAAVDGNVILLLTGMMTITGVLKETNVFSWLVYRLVQHAKGQPEFLLGVIMAVTAALSALLDNVTTVILMAPIAQRVAQMHRIPVWPLFLPLIVASNIGGTATLIGDPPNIIIGSGAGLSFLDFLLNLTVPVVVMTIVTQRFARRYYRSQLAAAHVATHGIRDPVLLRWSLYVLAMVLAGFLLQNVMHIPVAVPAFIGAIAILSIQDYRYLKRRHLLPMPEARRHGILKIIENEIEWPVLAFFFALFIVMAAATNVGLTGLAANGLADVIAFTRDALELSDAATLFVSAGFVLWLSGTASMVVDNIPFTIAAIPVIAHLTRTLPGDTEVLWWALSLGACLGGNGTLIGASANVTAVGMTEKLGQSITFIDFLRFGLPVTGITLCIASLYLVAWVTWGGTLTNGFAAFVLLVAYRKEARQTCTRLAPVVAGTLSWVQRGWSQMRGRVGRK